jgi:hypothetical protein
VHFWLPDPRRECVCASRAGSSSTIFNFSQYSCCPRLGSQSAVGLVANCWALAVDAGNFSTDAKMLPDFGRCTHKPTNTTTRNLPIIEALRKHCKSYCQFMRFSKLSSICQAGIERQRYRLMNNVVGSLKMAFAGTTLNCDDDCEPQSAFRAMHYQIRVPSSAINK